jgi:hypothetical protein
MSLAASAVLLVLISSAPAAAAGFVVPPQGVLLQKIYSYLSAAWWKRFIELPLEGNPFFDSTGDLVGAGQTGPLWFVAAPISDFVGGPYERHYTVPGRTSLFIAILNAECSSLEGGPGDPFYGGTEAEQRACANQFADYIQDVFFEIDGVPVRNIEAHRVESPQFRFTAPDPNILGFPGGEGTAVADGYFVLLAPLSVGEHTIHYGGRFVGTPFGDFGSDVTDHITVEGLR